MRIAFYTLGCKVNQYETQALERLFAGRGHTLVPFEGEADVYVINSCTVTAVSDKKSRQMVRQAIRLSSFVTLPMLLGMFAAADTMVEVLLGDKWLICVPFLRIM